MLAPVERALRLLLIDAARQTKLLSYSQVADALASIAPTRLEKPFSPLHGWLGAVSKFELQAGRPLLSALVVTQDSGLPGEGFFRFARQLGLQVGDETQFWNAQCRAIYGMWRSNESVALVTTHKTRLTDGREVRIREYAGGALRVLVDDAPYVISEAFLTKGKSGRAIIRLEPRLAMTEVSQEEEVNTG